MRGSHRDRKSTRLNSSHDQISYAVFCLKKRFLWSPPSHPCVRYGTRVSRRNVTTPMSAETPSHREVPQTETRKEASVRSRPAPRPHVLGQDANSPPGMSEVSM